MQFNFADIPQMPKSVIYHFDYMQGYSAKVTAKWPCPEGYEEIEYGDNGEVFDRRNLTPATIVSWHDFNYSLNINRNGLAVGVNPIWYIKKVV